MLHSLPVSAIDVTSRCAPRRQFSRRLLLGALIGMIGVTMVGADVAAWGADSPDPVVRLVVDYGDGMEKHFTQLKWTAGATVFDMLQAASQHPRGIRVQHRGKGATVLVVQIDDVANEGGVGRSRNWIYRVNDHVGERSAGICPVEPDDTILWSFETYR